MQTLVTLGIFHLLPTTPIAEVVTLFLLTNHFSLVSCDYVRVYHLI